MKSPTKSISALPTGTNEQTRHGVSRTAVLLAALAIPTAVLSGCNDSPAPDKGRVAHGHEECIKIEVEENHLSQADAKKDCDQAQANAIMQRAAGSQQSSGGQPVQSGGNNDLLFWYMIMHNNNPNTVYVTPPAYVQESSGNLRSVGRPVAGAPASIPHEDVGFYSQPSTARAAYAPTRAASISAARVSTPASSVGARAAPAVRSGGFGSGGGIGGGG